MSDKLNFSSASLGRLQSYSLLVLEGPDAVAFIQAQSMNDAKSLADGQWQWNGLLNPKGRLIALFALIRIRADLLYLLSPDFPSEKLAQHLQRFVFRSKVKLMSNADCAFVAEWGHVSSSSSARDFISDIPGSGIALDFSSETDARRLILAMPASAVDAPYDESIEAAWRDRDIEHGLPRLMEAQSELWTPQMLSLERLNAFSLKKGCYPGQEIVARTHYLGQAKRGIWRVRGIALSVGDAIQRNGEKIGEIICIGSNQEFGLALLQNGAESDLLTCGENEVKALQALTGLQRPI